METFLKLMAPLREITLLPTYTRRSFGKELFMARTKGATATAVKSRKKPAARPTQEEIALRAYHIFLERGSRPGNPMEDWLRAERELSEQITKPGRKPKIVSIAA
jgi:hypothetical protein